MVFTNPLGLLALLAIPAIIAMHMFRRKFPPKQIAGLFLWQIGQKPPQHTGRIERPPVTVSLFLECLAALALSLLLAGARLDRGDESQHLVVLLDDSVSMAAKNAQGESPRDRGVRRVLDEIEKIGRTGRVTLILSGEQPTVLCGPSALPVEAKRLIESWQPQTPAHSLAMGLRLARELAGQNGLLMVATDSLPPQPVEGALWLALGQSLANVGITSAQRTLSPEEGTGIISLGVSNFSSNTERRKLRVLAGGKEVLTQDIEVAPGYSSFNLPIAPGLPALRVTLSDDALASDNEVMLVEPRLPVVGIENRLPEGRGRQALEKSISALSRVTRAEQGHLVLGAAAILEGAPTPGKWRVGFGVPPSLVGKGEAVDLVGPFLPEKKHPLLQGLTFAGIIWSGVRPIVAADVQPLLSGGDLPLVAQLGSRLESGLLINLDLERTNLIRSPDWPILISNIVELRRQHLPGPSRWNLRVGEWVRVRLTETPAKPLRLRIGNYERTLPATRQLEFPLPLVSGLAQILDGDTMLCELGVNFLDDQESDLRDRASGELGKLAAIGGGPRAEVAQVFDPMFWILLAVLTGAVLGNWSGRRAS